MVQGSILNFIPDPTVMHCLHIALAVEQRQADLKLLEAPDIGTGVGGKPKVLVPKAVDADEEEDDDDDNASESSDDEVSCVLGVFSQECVHLLLHVMNGLWQSLLSLRLYSSGLDLGQEDICSSIYVSKFMFNVLGANRQNSVYVSL